MLLWLMNLDFAGSSLTFFISGEIPVEAVNADIPAQFEAVITIQSDGTVST